MKSGASRDSSAARRAGAASPMHHTACVAPGPTPDRARPEPREGAPHRAQVIVAPVGDEQDQGLVVFHFSTWACAVFTRTPHFLSWRFFTESYRSTSLRSSSAMTQSGHGLGSEAASMSPVA